MWDALIALLLGVVWSIPLLLVMLAPTSTDSPPWFWIAMVCVFSWAGWLAFEVWGRFGRNRRRYGDHREIR